MVLFLVAVILGWGWYLSPKIEQDRIGEGWKGVLC